MTNEEAKAEIRKVFEPAFANYIIMALTEGATPSERRWIPVTERLLDECEDAEVPKVCCKEAYSSKKNRYEKKKKLDKLVEME